MKYFALFVLVSCGYSPQIQDLPFCTPQTCEEMGVACSNYVSDGCGNFISCGAPTGDSCCNGSDGTWCPLQTYCSTDTDYCIPGNRLDCHDGTSCPLFYPYYCPNVNLCFQTVPTVADCDSQYYNSCN